MKVFKAQWPLSTNAEGPPQVLIYEADKRDGKWYYLDATPDVRAQLFSDKYVRVYFRGSIEGKTVNVDEFVRRGEWL
jgi:glucan-binding YG repeat protein